MAIEVLQELIDKQDNFEIIRDQIALILATESANQQAKATAASEDPELWAFDVYTEQSNPIEKWLNYDPESDEDTTPIVNVWVDNMQFDKSKSNAHERQMSGTLYNIDCYTFGMATDNPAGGHNPGDKKAATEAARIIKLIRNILMSSINVVLQLRNPAGQVADKWPQSINFFQPEFGKIPVPHVYGCRFALLVNHNEFSPQYEGITLDNININITRADDGKILAEIDYPST